MLFPVVNYVATDSPLPTSGLLVVSDTGEIATSEDGTIWVESAETISNPVTGLAQIVPWDAVNNYWYVVDQDLPGVARFNINATTKTNSGVISDLSGGELYGLAYKSSNSTIMVCGYHTAVNNTTIWKTTNFGSSWTRVNISASDRYGVNVIYDSTADRWTLLSDNGNFWYSDNDGANWTQASSASNGNSGAEANFITLGTSNHILGADGDDVAKIQYSANGTSYNSFDVTDGVDLLSSYADVFAFNGTTYITATSTPSGTDDIATTTNPATVNGWTLFDGNSSFIYRVAIYSPIVSKFVIGGYDDLGDAVLVQTATGAALSLVYPFASSSGVAGIGTTS